jgi:CBS domain containing-hemolysin-like protein
VNAQNALSTAAIIVLLTLTVLSMIVGELVPK